MRKKLLLKDTAVKGCVLLLFCLITSLMSVKSQTITWDGLATGLSPATVTISGDAAKLRFSFVATGSAVNDAKILVTLPVGYSGTAIVNGPTLASGITYTTSGLNSGTVTVTISGGSLAAGKTVDLILDVKAGCSAATNGNATIEVKSGGTTLGTGTRQVAIVGAYPALRVQSSAPNQSNPTIGHTFNFVLDMDVSNGLIANSFVLMLTKENNTTLTNFKLDGVAITPVVSGNTFKLTFNDINLASTAKQLTFDASATYAGTKNITSSLQYLSGPSGSSCGSPITGPVFTFGSPAVPGSPSIAIISHTSPDNLRTGWVNSSNSLVAPVNSNTQVPMDGVTIAYFRVVYENTGTAQTKQIKQSLQTYRSAIYTYANIVKDESKIKYSVDGGVTIKTAPVGSVAFSDDNPENNGYRILKSAWKDQPRKAEITINDPLPAGQKLVVYWPVVQGDVYDNSTLNPTAFASNYPWASIQWNYYNITAVDQNGATVAVPQNTYGAGAINNPLFSSTPPSLSFRETGVLSQQQVTILTEFGTVSGTTQYSELYIQLPNWLELNGSPAAAITTTGIAPSYPQSLGGDKYVLRVNAGGKRNVTIKYKVKTGSCAGVNKTGEIYYWLDFVLGGGSAAKRPPMKEIGQIRQKVTLLCEGNGIEMEEFKPIRLSKGLKDSDQDRVPDANTPALDTEILHDTYLEMDKGKLIVKGKVLNSYGALYLLLSSPTLSLSTQNITSATIKVNGGTAQTMTLSGSGSSLTFWRSDSFLANDQIEIEIPFTARTTNVTATVKAELYMAAGVGGTRVGKDELFTGLKLYSPGFASDKGNVVFSTNTPVPNFDLAYKDSYHGNNFIYPFFEKEYRVVGKLKYYDITLPKGYIIPTGSSLTMTFNTGYTSTTDVKAQSPDNVKIISTPPIVTENADGSTMYRFNLMGVYQDAYNGDGTYAAMSTGTTGKWIYPDDRYFYNFSTTVQATPAAVASGIIRADGIYTSYADNYVQEKTSRRDFNVAYTGDKATLSLSATSVTAYNKRITLPVLGVSNASTTNKSIWLYIKSADGSFTIKESSATGSGPVINGQGTGAGKWIHLGSSVAPGTHNYELSFTVDGVPCSGTKDVEIYLFADFGTPFTPVNVNAAPVLPNYTHLGDTKTLSFSASTAKIAGSISVNDNSIKYQVPYTFTAELSAAGGQGDVYGGQMTITVPAGQKYKATTAKYVYGGTNPAVPANVESDLVSILGGATNAARTYTFKISDFLPGDSLAGGGGGAPANQQTIQLVMDFTSECETNLLGSAFTATIHGNSVCGAAATGDNTSVAEQRMDFTSNILFTSTIALQEGINAFNEIHYKDTLQIDMTKTFGSGNLTQNDSIEIILHENIDVEAGGNIVVNSMDFASVTLPFNASTAAGKRTLKIELPWNELNALGLGGQGRSFTYKIPLEYTAADTVSPENKIEVNVWNEIRLDPGCNPQMFPVGSDELKMALAVGNTNPDTVYVGDVLPLEILSAGFGGSWYDAQTGGSLISSSNPWLFTPTMADLGDTTFYFSAEFSSINYGRLPYNLKVWFHPEFIRDLDTMAIACSDEEVLSVEAIGMDLKYQWYYNLTTPITGATDTFYVAKYDGFYHVIATDSVGEWISSDTLHLYFNVTPEFTKDLPLKVKECEKWGYTLGVESTGHHLIYQWYRNGIEIPGANECTYYALSNDSSAFFRVSIKTVCGDSIMSQQCYLSFCDEEEYVDIKRPVELVVPNTVVTDPRPGINHVQSHENFTFTVKVADGYSLKYMHIVTDDPIWTEQGGGIIKEMISETEMKVTIQTVIKPLTVTIIGVTPVSNETVEDGSNKAWAYDGKLYIQTEQDETVYIYTTMGHLYQRVDVKAGLTLLDAVDGVYFITFSKSGYSGKVFVK